MKRSRVGTAVAVVLLALMVVYLATQRDLLIALRSIPPWMVGALIAVSIVGLVIQSFQFRTAIGIHGIELPLPEATALTVANTMANYYLPARGGTVVRAAYMKRVYRFPLTQYAAVTVSVTGLTMLTAAVFGFLGLLMVGLTDGDVDDRVLASFVGVVVAATLGVVLAIAVTRMFKSGSRLARIAGEFRSGMSLWANSRGRLAVFLLWTVLLFGSQAFRLWLSFRAVGVTVGLGSILVIQALVSVAFILALTPGNIGVKEGAIVFAAGFLGVDPGLALLASLVDRAASLLVTFGGGLLSVRYLSHRAVEVPDQVAPLRESTVEDC